LAPAQRSRQLIPPVGYFSAPAPGSKTDSKKFCWAGWSCLSSKHFFKHPPYHPIVLALLPASLDPREAGFKALRRHLVSHTSRLEAGLEATPLTTPSIRRNFCAKQFPSSERLARRFELGGTRHYSCAPGGGNTHKENTRLLRLFLPSPSQPAMVWASPPLGPPLPPSCHASLR
jgi:hypothetical protein